MAEHWAFVDDIAKHLGVIEGSVYGCLERKGLPAHRMGHFWRCESCGIGAWPLRGGAAAEAVGDADVSGGPEPGTREG